MTPDNVQALPTGTRLGDFRLDAVIGHGSFGITYRAFDTQLAKVVAIKEYLPVEYAVRGTRGEVVARGARFADDFAWGRERFLDEARALARFRHPHIVPVLRYFEANGTAYTAMEFEDGRSLAEVLHDGRQLAPDEVRRLTEGMLSGLAAVHEQGFLHRDIKPSNIIIRRDGVPVLIDFGAARQAMGNRTQTLTTVMTPQYAPIEQFALDGKQGPWSDIYSAAAVLHHAITGKAPPQAASRVGRDPYRPLADSEAGRYPAALLSAVDRGLAFAPQDRPQSVAEWRALFGAALPSARDASTQRMTRRMPEPAAAAAPAAPAPASATTSTAPRLGGVSRDHHDRGSLPVPAPRSAGGGGGLRTAVVLAVLVGGGALAWHFLPDLQGMFASTPSSKPTQQTQAPVAPTVTPVPSRPTPAPTPSKPPTPPASPQPTPTPQAASQPAPTPTPSPTPLKPAPNASPSTPTPAPSTESVSQKALLGQAEAAASAARTAAERAKEASDTARSAAGEARIAAARAARSGLENAERIPYPNGASYVGQVSGGKRAGLGVADLENGERQAGEWKDDALNGLGTVRLSDGTRYEGQWQDGQSSGLGVREKPGAERAEGNFAKGRLEGYAVRRVTGDQSFVQAGEFHGDLLEGPGTETMPNGERYEGEFRGGKRQGYGQVVIPDGKAQPGRWEAGQLVEQPPP